MLLRAVGVVHRAHRSILKLRSCAAKRDMAPFQLGTSAAVRAHNIVPSNRQYVEGTSTLWTLLVQALSLVQVTITLSMVAIYLQHTITGDFIQSRR